MKSNRQVKQKKATSRRRRDMVIPHPLQLNGTELRHSVTMRFVANAAFVSSISFQNLLDTYLVATSATALFDVFQTVKVREVRVWAAAILGAATSVSLEYAGQTVGIVGDNAIHTATSMGIEPAFIRARPAVKCLASNYQVSSAAVAFNLSVPVGTVVDVDLSFRGNLITPGAAAGAGVGANTGGFYLRGLDGLAAAATKFTPEYPATI